MSTVLRQEDILSLLYLPADRLDRLERALSSGSSCVVVDLEDGVAPAAKAEARRAVARLPVSDAIAIRIDGAAMADDLDAALSAGVRRIVVPKAEMATIERFVSLLEEPLESRPTGSNPPDIHVTALIESARGLFDALPIAEHPRVSRLALGEADLSADLGVTPGPDELELLTARSTIVAASAAAGLPAPVGGVFTAVADNDGLARSTRRLIDLGFGARSAIHPDQIPIINSCFAPSSEEVAAAREVIDTFEAAVAAGRGAVMGADGSMIDEAVVRSARAVLGRASR